MLLDLMNESRSYDELTVSEIADQLDLEKISSLENYFSGYDEPPIEVLRRIADHYFLDMHWLLHGKGSPFYRNDPFSFEPGEALGHIQSTEPEQIFFVRSDSEHGECT